MAFFNRGDAVTVRCDLEDGRIYYDDGAHDSGCNATRTMTQLAGMPVTISEVSYFNATGAIRYYLKEDPYDYYWTDEMFEEYLHRNDPEPDIELQTSEEFLSFLLS